MIAGPLDPNEEGMVIAEIAIEEIIDQKLQHDIAGNYNRFDVLSLNLNPRVQKPIWTAAGPEDHSEESIRENRRLLEEIKTLLERLTAAIDHGACEGESPAKEAAHDIADPGKVGDSPDVRSYGMNVVMKGNFIL